ncbi:MAG: lysophospholipid acyltransferase family protein [Oceanicoccus sp.]
MKTVSYILLAGFLRLVSWVPLRLLRAVGRILGTVLWALNSRARRVSEENIQACFPQMDKSQRLSLVRRSMQNLGMTALEMGYVWRRSPQATLSRITQVLGQEHLVAAVSEGRGAIVLAPHLGNWEFIGPYLGLHYQATLMYQPPKNWALDKIIFESRENTGAKLVPTNTSGVKAQWRALKKGGVVGILPDQVPPAESGAYAPFFGVPALTPTMTFNLLSRTGARAVMAYAKRIEGTGDFIMVIEPAPEGIYSSDVQVSLSAMNAGIERCVMAAPEQYQWEYKRFKRQPDGDKKFYQ